MQLTHRCARPCAAGDGIIEAVIHGLRTVTPGRLGRHHKLLLAHEAALAIVDPTSALPTSQQVPIEIRTSSRELIEAGMFLRSQAAFTVDVGAAHSLWQQLRRFDISWVLLPADSAEVTALGRWARCHCVPGINIYRDGPSREDWCLIATSYETLGWETAGVTDMIDAPEAEKTSEDAEYVV